MPIIYKISSDAYCKSVLHAAQHVGAVHGLLLGRFIDRRENNDAAKSAHAEGNPDGVVEILDAFPVAHSALACGTSPVTEIALLIAETRAKALSLKLIGAYYAPEIADDVDIPVMPTRLADALRSKCKYACLLFLHAAALSPDQRQSSCAFRLHTLPQEPSSSGSWARGLRDEKHFIVEQDTLMVCDGLLGHRDNVYSVYDFEDHCLDPTRDWFNTDFSQAKNT